MESSENEGGAGAEKHEKPGEDQPVQIDISALIKQFEQKTPLEHLRILAPELPDDQLAGLFAGLGMNLGIPMPDWAIAASKQFWKYFVGADFDPFKSPQHAGVLVGLAEQMMAISPQPEPQQFGTWIKPLLAWFLEESSKDAQKLTPADAAKFHTGRAKSAAVVAALEMEESLQCEHKDFKSWSQS
ncbi:MAG TPA: hypothetical protein VN873_19800 [Candidatus Angelobacter sp.]|nr:hypothetical protein [Candidatus Angelobacter sp.]